MTWVARSITSRPAAESGVVRSTTTADRVIVAIAHAGIAITDRMIAVARDVAITADVTIAADGIGVGAVVLVAATRATELRREHRNPDGEEKYDPHSLPKVPQLLRKSR